MNEQRRKKEKIYILMISIGLLAMIFISIGVNGKERRKEKVSASSVTETKKSEKESTKQTKKTEDTPIKEVLAQDNPTIENGIKNVSVEVGANGTSLNFNWFISEKINRKDKNVYLEIAPYVTGNDGDFTSRSTKWYPDESKALEDGYYINKVVVEQLEPGIDYTYRIVSPNNITKANVIKAVWNKENITDWIIFADAQLMIDSMQENKENFSNTLHQACSNFKESSLFISMGDQINSKENQIAEYENFLDCMSKENRALAPVVGNHDEKGSTFNQYFNVPNLSSLGESKQNGGDYYFRIGEVLVMVLNSNCYSKEEHGNFLSGAMSANSDASWRVVLFHHSIFSVGDHVYNKKIQKLKKRLTPLMNEYNIDLVINGHDHVYARTYPLQQFTPVIKKNEDGTPISLWEQPEGPIYTTINSASGSKYYEICKESFNYTAVDNQEFQPNFSRLYIKDGVLSFTTYRSGDMSIVDSFSIKK